MDNQVDDLESQGSNTHVPTREEAKPELESSDTPSSTYMRVCKNFSTVW